MNAVRRFRDLHGMAWAVKLTEDVLTDIHARLGIDLDRLQDRPDKYLDAIAGGPDSILRLIMVICRLEREARGLSVRHFVNAVYRGGEIVTGVRDALLGATKDKWPLSVAGWVIERALKEWPKFFERPTATIGA
jgi:hypothetical protein